ncbi:MULTISPECIES: hypothetical protein [Streptomyces]|uniref:Uncharacterized protein n=1 Tax=Streptomyces cacaoi TaxID=1898 RepID=A0A4Y3RBD5_STRCI|nr:MULTISPECIES: hypothetical protein [Streptomyces]NNG88593.1 hypothetical protein [Streptomyces cacaoi]GEB53993.1 hypothetical protein SCA03_65440 [Streptomyces cacaoi]
MYEPIRTASIHTVAESTLRDLPRRTRQEELDIRLAGHLTALLTVTDELRVLAPEPALEDAARELAAHVERLSGRAPLRAEPSRRSAGAAHIASLHTRARRLAGNALSVATSRGDEAAAELAAGRLRVHESSEAPVPA